MDASIDFNPVISPELRYKNGKRFYVIRDDQLTGGTKQRALYPYLIKLKAKYPDITELLYAGPDTGYAQIALAYVGFHAGFRVNLFLQSSTGKINNLTLRAAKLGAKYTLIKNDLKTVTETAEKYVKEHSDSMLVPFGLDTPEYEEELVSALKVALKKVPEPKTLWLTVGSGALMKAISTVWPNVHINAVVVGRKIYWEDYPPELKKRVDVYNATEYNPRSYPGSGGYKFFQSIPKNLLPPYPSLATYDGKLWIFASADLSDGDYIWNVGKD